MKKRIIGSNFHSKDENWRKVLSNPWDYVNKAELALKEGVVRKKVKNAVDQGEALGLAWSGGKDSLVLYEVLKGIRLADYHFVTFKNKSLYFRETRLWYAAHQPKEVVELEMPMTIEQIRKGMFPRNARAVKKWLEPKWKVLRERQKERPLDWTLMGRRIDDGNKVESEWFKAKNGMKTWNPLRDWTNEEVAAYIVWKRIILPPDYSFKDVFKYGVCAWPLTDEKTVKERAPDIWEILKK